MSISEEEAVWQKGTIVQGNDPAVWRKDKCGAWIGRNLRGRTDSEYGWEIDHIKSLDRGGTEDLTNKQPLQWENNRKKAAGSLDCAVTANPQGTEGHNIPVK